MQPEPIPRLPVFGWQAMAGARDAGTPCLLSLPGMHYTTSGRASILLALEALGVGPGDRVLLPTYHCPTMVAPATGRGALPMFYPIDEGGAPRLDWLQQQDLTGARAMLVAHFFGLPQPLAAIRQWCDERGIALIEDCAHALFGRSGSRPVGAWGDIAIASLTKFLPVPEGGCLVMNNGASPQDLMPCGAAAQIKTGIDIVEVGATQHRLTGLNSGLLGAAALLRRLRGGSTQPRADEPELEPTGGANQLAEAKASAEFSIDSALAHRALAAPCRWVGQALPRERIVQTRRRHFELLGRALNGHTGLRPLRHELPADCAPYVFPLWVDDPDPGYAELRRRRMPVFRWDRLWSGVPSIEGDCGRDWSHHVLQLACHQDMTATQIDRFVSNLVDVYGP